jgi:hypothetical protein
MLQLPDGCAAKNRQRPSSSGSIHPALQHAPACRHAYSA